jgi:hypothetical protein
LHLTNAGISKDALIFLFVATVPKIAKNIQNKPEHILSNNHTAYGMVHNRDASSHRGPQEANIGALKQKSKILANHVMNFGKIDTFVGFCMALSNLTDHLELLVEQKCVEPCFLDDEWIATHEFFITDYSKSISRKMYDYDSLTLFSRGMI